MRVENLRSFKSADRVRVAATMVWEDCSRPDQDVYFECSAAFADDVAPNPDAFLLACAIPATDYRERRIRIDGSICPELRDGLKAAFRVIADWYPRSRGPVIECTAGFRPRSPRRPPRVASFMSAGIDALSTLHCNRANFPLVHEGSIRDCFFFFGFNRHDIDARGPVPERLQDFERRLDRLTRLARDSNIHLIPVHANIRYIAKSHTDWNERGMGASLASIAHIFSRRISRVLIASGGNVGVSSPWGSHPLLDPNFSSTDLEVRHDGLHLSRLQKTAVVSDWPAAMNILQTCWENDGIPENVNCGRCGKCLRTMVHLAALGKQDQAPTFRKVRITPEIIYKIGIAIESDVSFLEECVEPFEKLGRHDLVDAIRKRVREFWNRRYDRGWRNRIRRWDDRFTRGLIVRLARNALRPLRGSQKNAER